MKYLTTSIASIFLHVGCGDVQTISSTDGKVKDMQSDYRVEDASVPAPYWDAKVVENDAQIDAQARRILTQHLDCYTIMRADGSLETVITYQDTNLPDGLCSTGTLDKITYDDGTTVVSECSGYVWGEAELLNNKDDDCNGYIDEQNVSLYFDRERTGSDGDFLITLTRIRDSMPPDLRYFIFASNIEDNRDFIHQIQPMEGGLYTDSQNPQESAISTLVSFIEDRPEQVEGPNYALETLRRNLIAQGGSFEGSDNNDKIRGYNPFEGSFSLLEEIRPIPEIPSLHVVHLSNRSHHLTREGLTRHGEPTGVNITDELIGLIESSNNLIYFVGRENQEQVIGDDLLDLPNVRYVHVIDSPGAFASKIAPIILRDSWNHREELE